MKRILSFLLILLLVLSVPLTVSATTDKEASRVQALIDTIPDMGEITLEKEAAIREIETAYNTLTKSQKDLVDATHLENALATIKALRQVKIDELIALIAKIGDKITLEDEPVIAEATEIYDRMTMVEREQIDYIKLSEANNALKKLQKAAAKEVDALISAIGAEITNASGDAIAAARNAYDALTPGSKEYVTCTAALREAEQLYQSVAPHINLGSISADDSDVRLIFIFAAVGLLVIAPAIVIPIVIVISKRRQQSPYYQ